MGDNNVLLFGCRKDVIIDKNYQTHISSLVLLLPVPVSPIVFATFLNVHSNILSGTN